MLKHVETVEKSVAHIVSCCKAACQSAEALDALKFGFRSPGESLQILHIASLRHCGMSLMMSYVSLLNASQDFDLSTISTYAGCGCHLPPLPLLSKCVAAVFVC